MYYISTRWLLRFEFQLPHPILSPALATVKKWPLSQFHISYQNSEISWPKVPISDFQSQFSMSKIIRNFLKKKFIEEYHFRGTFFVIDIFFKSIFKALYLLKLGPFFVSWFPSFGKRYGNDLRVIFYQWPKLCIGLDVEADIQILKGINDSICILLSTNWQGIKHLLLFTQKCKSK